MAGAFPGRPPWPADRPEGERTRAWNSARIVSDLDRLVVTTSTIATVNNGK